MLTFPINPEFQPEEYRSPVWSLRSIEAESKEFPALGGYPVSGDDLSRWRKALAS